MQPTSTNTHTHTTTLTPLRRQTISNKLWYLSSVRRRTNNKGGPHNVVFDEDNIPAGVDQEKISMSDQLGEEGATFTMSFDTSGTYGYYCEPHRGAGMQATLIVA